MIIYIYKWLKKTVFSPHDVTRHVVQVKDRWVGVQAGRVELIRVGHREVAKRRKVLCDERLLDGGDPLGDYVLRAVGEELRCGDRVLHAVRRADLLLGGAGNEHQRPQLRPVRLAGYLHRHRVAGICLLALFPADEAAVEAATGAAAALPRYRGELTLVALAHTEQLSQRVDEARVARGRGCQTRRGREGVDRDHAHVVLAPVLLLDDGRPVHHAVAGHAAQLLQTRLEAARDRLLLAIQPQPAQQQQQQQRQQRRQQQRQQQQCA